MAPSCTRRSIPCPTSTMEGKSFYYTRGDRERNPYNLTAEEIEYLYIEKRWSLELLAKTLNIGMPEMSHYLWDNGLCDKRNEIIKRSGGYFETKTFSKHDIDEMRGQAKSIEDEFFDLL